MTTIEIIKDILNENLQIPADKVTDTATFDDLGIDSLDMVELICELEDRCEIDFGEPEDLHTVADLVAYVDSIREA